MTQCGDLVPAKLNFECWLMDGQMDGQTDGRYQVHYLPASRSIISMHEIVDYDYRKRNTGIEFLWQDTD